MMGTVEGTDLLIQMLSTTPSPVRYTKSAIEVKMPKLISSLDDMQRSADYTLDIFLRAQRMLKAKLMSLTQ
ncbi:hypothetical protein SDC9_11383 [bioreactor metagenome]|uniref:Uncharacterized protein n=1 Tax=bioreactor metagenome TaxID=1076179 RepID=A0A644TG89_9ZZZZ